MYALRNYRAAIRVMTNDFIYNQHLARNKLPRTHSMIVYHTVKKSVDQAYVHQFPLERRLATIYYIREIHFPEIMPRPTKKWNEIVLYIYIIV